MAHQQFSIDGLHCQGCVHTVSEALMTLPAVTAVDVDLDTKGTSTVRIDAEPPLSAAEVQAAGHRRELFCRRLAGLPPPLTPRAGKFGQHRVVGGKFVVGVVSVGVAVCTVSLAAVASRPLCNQHHDHDDHRQFA